MSFKSLGLSEAILRAVKEEGYNEPTPIQKQVIPIILERKDVLAGAQTGTGKTAGFTLPILQLLSLKEKLKTKPKITVLVLTPTRELAMQVEQSIKTYGKYLPFQSCVVFGGVNINPQILTFQKGIDILVATPGRLLDHIDRKSVNLSHVETLVLDEADRMLDMGFINDIKKVLATLPKKRQNLLFSATFSNEIKALADKLLNKPILVEATRSNTASNLIKQIVHLVDKDKKRALLSQLIKDGKWSQVLVFTRTKHGANKLSAQLEKDGIQAAAIHGNKSQNARIKALSDLKSGTIKVLVATDIAARGIDIDQLPHVVNFELPNISEDYVHRIGRTGRAGSKGEAISLVSIDEHGYLKDIEKLIGYKIPKITIDGFQPDLSIKPEATKPKSRPIRKARRR